MRMTIAIDRGQAQRLIRIAMDFFTSTEATYHDRCEIVRIVNAHGQSCDAFTRGYIFGSIDKWLEDPARDKRLDQVLTAIKNKINYA